MKIRKHVRRFRFYQERDPMRESLIQLFVVVWQMVRH